MVPVAESSDRQYEVTVDSRADEQTEEKSAVSLSCILNLAWVVMQWPASFCPSVRPSVCFHSVFVTD